jgi:signal transduction histidine kinase/ActR/RegA family two-component response regulator
MISSRLRPRNLNQALGWLLACVIVPLLLGALALLVVQSRQAQLLTQNQLSTLAQTLVQAVDRELDYGEAQLEVIAALPVIDARNWQQLHRFGSDVAGRRPGNLIALVGPDGQVLLNTAVPLGQPLQNLWKWGEEGREVVWEGRTLPLSSQNLTREVFERARVVYSDLYHDGLLQRPALALSVPVIREGKVLYALTLSFPPALLQQLIRSAVNAPGFRVLVVDRRGIVVACNAAAAVSMGDRALPILNPPGSLAGHYQIKAPDGALLSGAYAVSANNGFVVRISLPQAARFVPALTASAGWATLVIGALAASVFLAGFMGRRLAQPLHELGQAARDGLPPPEGPPTGIAEIDLLAQALRAGAEAERKRREEHVLRLGAEQKEALVKEAEAALRLADRQKDEFLATLAHELRNPLAPIRTAVELIRRHAPADTTVQRARDVIERQVLYLSRLVDDLLEVSRITLGTIHLRKEMLDLGAVATSAAESVRPALEAAGLTLEQQFGESAVTVLGDETRLAQCIVNLLNNAVKFTPCGGHIMLRVAQAGPTASVEVSDTGIGISSQNLERIFELFVQERPSGLHGDTGLGIGLALTRKLMALHGGRVWAESAGPGHGSTFRIELPAASPAAPSLPETPAHAPDDAAGARVLVVDDNRDAADVLGEMLAMSGFRTSVEYDGEEAVRAVEQQAPDAVLLDIGLVGIDGYEVCRRIRRADLAKQPVVIALTGWGQEQDRDRASAAGFDAHLTKPAEPDRIISLLKKLLTKQT